LDLKNTVKMRRDIVANGLNAIQNAKIAGRETVKINTVSNTLIEILKIMKQKGAIKKYKINRKEKSATINLDEVYKSRAIKPRFTVSKDKIEKYKRRYLPGRKVGTLIISTNKGLMTHEEAQEQNIGGVLIAYFY